MSTNLEEFFETVDIEYYLKQKKRVIDEYIKNAQELKEFEERHKEKR